MPSTPSDRLILFLKMAGGQTAVAEKTGITRSTFSNIMRNRSKPSFAVTKALLEAYPAFNLRWWFLGGEEPMWLDKPQNVDQDLVNYVADKKPTYNTRKTLDYSNYSKNQLIELLEEKDSILNDLLRGKNESVYVQKEQLNVLVEILQKLDPQGATTGDTQKQNITPPQHTK